MLDKNRKFIYIHIPKTGGSSIESFFGFNLWKKSTLQNTQLINSHLMGYCVRKKKFLQHLSIDEVAQHLYSKRDHFDQYFSFATIRNPWDRFLSSFFYECRSKTKDIANFREFCKKPYFFNPDHQLPQYKFIVNKSEKIIVNCIIRFENLENDFNKVCNIIGIPRKKLPHINKTKHPHYTEYYDRETRDIIKKRYERDIDYFEYQFGQ